MESKQAVHSSGNVLSDSVIHLGNILSGSVSPKVSGVKRVGLSNVQLEFRFGPAGISFTGSSLRKFSVLCVKFRLHITVFLSSPPLKITEPHRARTLFLNHPVS